MSPEERRLRKRRQNRRWDYLRATGRPSLLREGTPEFAALTARIRTFHGWGMPFTAMAAQTGLNKETFSLICGGKAKGVRRTTLLRAARVEFEEPARGAVVPAVGTRRRLQGMRADGFSYEFICTELGFTRSNPNPKRIMNGRRADQGKPVTEVTAEMALRVRRLYDKLDGVDPLEVGVPRHAVIKARNAARRDGFVPSLCWDDTTIDDPDAIPDWTGYCGTGLGMAVHRREKIPPCGPCKEAFDFRRPYPGFNGGKLRALRESKGYSRNGLGEIVGLNNSTFRDWERGASFPQRGGALDRVLSILDATYEDVCDLEGS